MSNPSINSRRAITRAEIAQRSMQRAENKTVNLSTFPKPNFMFGRVYVDVDHRRVDL